MDHPVPENPWHDNPPLAKWIPFVGPGAAALFLIAQYLIFEVVFKA